MSIDGGPAKRILALVPVARGSSAQHRAASRADGTLLCIEHGEHGDLIHPALRVLDPRTAATVGELLDEGMSLAAKCWSPAAGDQRLAFEHEREGDTRPALWNLETGEVTLLDIELDGEVHVHDWWPDASALLLVNTFEGRSQLYRYDIADGELTLIPSEPGYISSARVRPDGRVWFLHEQGASAAARARRHRCRDPRPRRAGAGVPPVRVLALREPTRADGARLPRDAGRLGRARSPCSCSSTGDPPGTTSIAGSRRCRRTSTPASPSGWSTTAVRSGTAASGGTRSSGTSAGPSSRT